MHAVACISHAHMNAHVAFCLPLVQNQDLSRRRCAWTSARAVSQISKNYIHTHIYIYIYIYIWPCLFCIRHSKSFKGGHHVKIMVLVEEDHDPCRRWWSWQSMMILAEHDDPGRSAWSWWNSMILVGNKQPPFRDHPRTTSGPFWQNSKINFPSSVD